MPSWVTGAIFLAWLGATEVRPSRYLSGAWQRLIEIIEWSILLVLVFLIGQTIVRAIRNSRMRLAASRAERVDGRPLLGQPYAIEAESGAGHVRRPYLLRLEAAGGVLAPTSVFAGAIEFTGPTAIRVKPSWIEVACGDDAIRLVPGSYADRERLLWEFAVHWPDAFEFAPQSATPSVASASPVPPPPREYAVAGEDLRSTGSGLGSALVGPVTPANPAPPRKSGLGNGLFPPAPGMNPPSS